MVAVPPSWAKTTVTVVRRTITGQDERGNDVYSETTTDYPTCRVQPESSDEELDNAVRVTDRWRVFGPADMDVVATDEIDWDGTRYEVHPEPQVWGSPTSALAHVEVVIREVSG